MEPRKWKLKISRKSVNKGYSLIGGELEASLPWMRCSGRKRPECCLASIAWRTSSVKADKWLTTVF